jgi:hypothetical protein
LLIEPSDKSDKTHTVQPGRQIGIDIKQTKRQEFFADFYVQQNLRVSGDESNGGGGEGMYE